MTNKQKLLFVCSQNKWRSLTAEKMFEKSSFYEVRSAGTHKGARIRITPGHIGWADCIVVMEKKHLEILRAKYADGLKAKCVICLNIPDQFQFMDIKLQELLRKKLNAYKLSPD